jgi:hypothetical protein
MAVSVIGLVAAVWPNFFSRKATLFFPLFGRPLRCCRAVPGHGLHGPFVKDGSNAETAVFGVRQQQFLLLLAQPVGPYFRNEAVWPIHGDLLGLKSLAGWPAHFTLPAKTVASVVSG